eukprot:CAMPEP_0179911038 /NCGR_PEP_ID=MMETSP0982-20121206/46113_1 /TAXON_ID=483367 /ORGANISM="non described non described, Strain CCMP 2436" /LENGTH=413 /DNA_ID=CAMNT_0021812683 /DNA_START=112 /DNA_END=1354 /DNA_ORIENTATION=-
MNPPIYDTPTPPLAAAQLLLCGLAAASPASSLHSSSPEAEVGAMLGPVFRGEYGSSTAEHERFGREMGAAFAEPARRRLARKRNALLVEWVSKDAAGTRTLKAFAEAHERLYPLFMAELRGIAAGVGVPFAHVLALNLHQELSKFCPDRAAVAPTADHCSDYVLWPWIAHNEDSGVKEAGTLFIAHVVIDGASFSGAVYAGDLPSGAFGFNGHGVGFTLNFVDPTEAAFGGVGRGFISRQLLTARSFKEAVQIAVGDGQAVGHSYQIFALSAEQGSGRIAQVESISHGRHAVQEVSEGSAPLFHTNHLLFLQPPVPQHMTTSSAHRLERARELPPPSSAQDLLAVLGDQADSAFPLFHDAGSRAAGDISGEETMATVLVDVARGTLTLLAGNPARQPRTLAVLRIPRPNILLD